MKYQNLNPQLTKKVRMEVERGRIKNQDLPQEVCDIFKEYRRTLSKEERNDYAYQLRKLGWSLESIARATGLTREMVRLIVKKIDIDTYYQSPHGLFSPSLPLPTPVRKIVIVSKRMLIDPETLVRLKELHAVAKTLRGKTTKNRDIAREFSQLCHDLTLQGISTYTISKALGLSVGAVNLRLVRYGYRITTGTSSGLRAIGSYKTRSKNPEVSS